MELWHTNFASIGRLPLFHDAKIHRPLAIRRLAKLGFDGLVLFCIVDDHVHLVLRGSRSFAGKVVSRIKQSWEDFFAGDVGGAFHRPVEDRSHLLSLISYFFDQPRIHGLGAAPHQWDGSCFFDLVGARWLPALRLELLDLLPRVSLSALYKAAKTTPPNIANPGTTNPTSLWEAVQRAFAVVLGHEQRSWQWVMARAAAVQLAQAAGIPRGEMLAVHPFGERTWRRMIQRPLPREALNAVRLQLALYQPRCGRELETLTDRNTAQLA
ncbi:MAG: hypothetical protein JRH20_19630 [Deltaproteobacteria bacterium]|nr:hypothetical protein [Deltaproteobacteria bacterium]